MSLASVMELESALLLPTYERHPVLFERGRGVFLWDASGKRYLDFLSGIGVNALGHGHPAVMAALARQSKKLIHVSNLFFHEHQAALAERLTGLAGLQRAFFCNSGTEAWEGALKLARAHARQQNKNGHRPRWRILAMENSFHGRTMGSLATTGQAKYRDPFAPLVPGVRFVRFNDCEHLAKQFDESVCAVCLETVQGEGGIQPVTAEFLALARKLTRKAGALLLVDEIQSGLGRTGRPFAYQHYDVQPDVVTVAKPLAAGLPLGAVLTTERVAHAFHPGMHGTTFGGGPLACAVALTCIDLIHGLLPQVNQLGEYFRIRLEEIASDYPCALQVRGLGLMLGLELDSADAAKQAVASLLQEGIVINRTHHKVLRFLPPYIVEKKQIDRVIRALRRTLPAPAAKPEGRHLEVARSFS